MILIQMNERSMKISLPHVDAAYIGPIVTIQYGNFYLPSAWARKNKIQRGDYVFIIGTSDGLILYAGPLSQEFQLIYDN